MYMLMSGQHELSTPPFPSPPPPFPSPPPPSPLPPLLPPPSLPQYPESPFAIPQKRVVFNISNSRASLNPGVPTTSPGQTSDTNTTTHTESPLIGETSVDIEKVKPASTSSKNDKETADETGTHYSLHRNLYCVIIKYWLHLHCDV